MNKLFTLVFALFTCICSVVAQTGSSKAKSADIKKTFKRIQKIDGVAAVVGSHIILVSDINRMYKEMQSQGLSVKDMTNCKLLDKIMEDRLYAHQAIQDSIVVSDDEIKQYVDKQIEYSLQQFDNDMSRLLEFYHKDNVNQLRSQLQEINKLTQLSQRMKSKIVEDVKVTPDEVKQYFKRISKENDLPYFGTELEISQIVIEPKIPRKETEKVVNELLLFKEDVEDNGSSFASKALLYSEDPGSRPRGGFYTLTKKSPMVQEFKSVTFGLKEGEISEPFKTEYGWHIIQLEKIRGDEYDIRHILLIPKVPEKALTEAYKKISTLRKRIIDGDISFKDAALKFSNEKETKFNEGKLINPATLDTNFELTKIDPVLYSQIEPLKDGEISPPLVDEDRSGKKKYKIVKIANRTDGHIANFYKDYSKIQKLALQEKKIKAVKDWVKSKVPYTYIYVNNSYKDCSFSKNWLKK